MCVYTHQVYLLVTFFLLDFCQGQAGHIKRIEACSLCFVKEIVYSAISSSKCLSVNSPEPRNKTRNAISQEIQFL